jgi:hypothetical protein
MKLNKPVTRTVVELAPEPNEERVVFNATQRVEESVSSDPESIPPLVQTRGEVLSEGSIPPLQPVQRTMRRIELAPVQPSAEVDAVAEPVTAGTDLDEEEQEAIQQELRSEQTGSHPILNRVSKRQVVQLGGAEASGDRNVAEQYADDILIDESAGAEANNDGQEGMAQEQRIPPLEPVVRSQEAIPPLVMTRDGGALPEGVTSIPALTAYNKMEVVHLLIGRSVEDEEVVLLQSFPERFIRSKKPEELMASLYARVQEHVDNMTQHQVYDINERRTRRIIQVVQPNQQQQARGITWAAGYLDNGVPTHAEVQQYCEKDDLDDDEALRYMKEEGFYSEPSFVFTWALVKVKIGHDFGSFKLSELMPSL